MPNVKAEDFEKAVNTLLVAYTDEVRKGINEAIPQIAKQGAKELKGLGTFEDRTGKYRKGWTYTIEQSRTGVEAVIHNKKYQLTHLLEKGHAKQNGGRTRAFPHIADEEQKVIEDFTKKVEEIIQG